MPSRLSRFTDRLVTLPKRAVSGDPLSAVKKGDGGYADWVIVVIHGLREYLDLPYRRLLDILLEMHGIVEKLNLEPSELPDFTPSAHGSSSSRWQPGELSYGSPLIFTIAETCRLSMQLASSAIRAVTT